MSPRPRATGGFSLVEIVIAIGVLGFAILPIIGILSVGVSQSGETVRNTMITQILAQVNAQVRQMAFADLTNVATPLYFDEEGVLTTNTAKALWKTYFFITNATLPATNGSNSVLGSARLVTVVTDFVPSGGGSAAIASRSQTNFLYVNNRGGL